MILPSLDGSLQANPHVSVPVSTRRLQAMISRKGIKDIFLWGNGKMGSLSFLFSIPESAIQKIQPNRTYFSWGDGYRISIIALEKDPHILIQYNQIENFKVRLTPHHQAYSGVAGKVHNIIKNKVRIFELAHGNIWYIKIENDNSGWLLLGAGTDKELEYSLSSYTGLSSFSKFSISSDEYLEWLTSRFHTKDPLLGSLFIHALHAAISSIKFDDVGNFAGLSAGYGYSLPARTYYRDGYWTVQALIPFFPNIVREEILILAHGIQENNEAPSGVIIATSINLQYWEALRKSDLSIMNNHKKNSEWWSDHFDSPLYFALMTLEYIQWTGDVLLLEERIGHRNIGNIICEIIDKYVMYSYQYGMPVKPCNDRDWADNVYRSGFVTYDIALFSGVLNLAIKYSNIITTDRGKTRNIWKKMLKQIRDQAKETLWLNSEGHFVEFIDNNKRLPHPIKEDHLTLETITAIRFGLIGSSETEILLATIREKLQTRNNKIQSFGDWGIMCAFPPYTNRNILRGKTIFPYRYHNGSDWPYLDGAYAQELLCRNSPDWHYALTRFWEYSLSQGWPEPVEYFSPPWGKGSPLQSWSSMAAAAMINGGFGFNPNQKIKVPPWGESSLYGVKLNGKNYNIVATTTEVTLEISPEAVHLF